MVPRRWTIFLAFHTLVLAASTVSAATTSKPIFQGSAAVPAANYVYFEFTVDGESQPSAALHGELSATGGSGNDIIVRVLDKIGYTNWKNGHTTDSLYSSGQVSAAEVTARFERSGTYYLIFDNSFSASTAKTVAGSVALSWTLPSAATSSPPSDDEVNLDDPETLLGLAVVGAMSFAMLLVGVGIGVLIGRRSIKKAS